MADSGKPRPDGAPGTEVSRASAKRASAAQMLLVARLKARNRRDLAVDTLERGAHVMWVTCKNWFSSGKPPPAAGSDARQTDIDNDDNKDNHAHRDR